MMKFNTPFPQTLPKECDKAAKIFQSFVDNRNKGLDGVIPRSVIENAKGFAIFSVLKAGFIFSGRAGSGIVVAKLPDGSWSAPSAIGTAGMGFGTQAGAEVTDFLITLNSQSAVKSFMAAGSFTLGGNISIALGPIGRNGEASGSLNTAGRVAAMYSYSKSKGLFGGVSIEGSVVVERQDANASAYGSAVSVRMLLNGVVPPPPWANGLIQTLNRTTTPASRNWIPDAQGAGTPRPYAFEGVASLGSDPQRKKKTKSMSSFPPASWGRRKDGGSYFASADSGSREVPNDARCTPPPVDYTESPSNFTTYFGSEVSADPHHLEEKKSLGLIRETEAQYVPGIGVDSKTSSYPRAIALYDFKAVEPGDLGFSKGDIITITEKSDKIDDWWTGTINGRQGIFPANFVKLT